MPKLSIGILLFLLLSSRAQTKVVEIGQIDMIPAHAAWPAPEPVVRDLRSPKEDIRLQALALVGVPEQLRHQPVVPGSGTASAGVSQEVVKPPQIELRYAALGAGNQQQAIVALQVGQQAYAAVINPTSDGKWERVATFNCWCKYDTRDFLGEFVTITQAPAANGERSELVIRASGGGSGLYTQDEAHFRLYRGEMKAVLHLVTRHVAFHLGIPKPYLEIDRRWFHAGFDENGQNFAGGILVEGHANLLPNAVSSFEVSPYEASIRDLESRHLGRLQCRPYEWSESKFQYVPSAASKPCHVGQP